MAKTIKVMAFGEGIQVKQLYLKISNYLKYIYWILTYIQGCYPFRVSFHNSFFFSFKEKKKIRQHQTFQPQPFPTWDLWKNGITEPLKVDTGWHVVVDTVASCIRHLLLVISFCNSRLGACSLAWIKVSFSHVLWSVVYHVACHVQLSCYPLVYGPLKQRC